MEEVLSEIKNIKKNLIDDGLRDLHENIQTDFPDKNAKVQQEKILAGNNQTNINSNQNLFVNLDKCMLTLFNEPSLGIYFTQQHIQNSFPTLLFNMDKLYDNRKLINNTILDLNNTEQEIKEITSLNEDFSFKMLARINSLNFELQRKKN